MLEVGWSEILVIALILIIVVGPKDLPPMLRTFGRMATRLRGMANEFKGQFDQALREADLDDVRKGLSEVNKLNPTNSLRDAMNPIRQLGQDIKADLRKASDIAPPAAAMPVKASDLAASGVQPVETAVSPVPVDSLSEVPPTPPVMAPLLSVPEKVSEPAVSASADPSASASADPSAKPRAVRRKAPIADLSADAGLVAEPKLHKLPAKAKAVAVEVAQEPVVKKLPTRRKPAVIVPVDSAEATPKKPSPRKKAEKAGDA